MKVKSEYVCTECGSVFGKWYGKCPSCGEWNTIEEQESEVPVQKSGFGKAAQRTVVPHAKPLSLSFDSDAIIEEDRQSTGIGEFDRVLGGGLVKGSVTLLSGEPGIGKSTLLLQICDRLPGKLLYVSGEESPAQIKLRAKRLGISGASMLLYTETDVEEVLAEIAAVSPDVVIIDSIQTMSDSSVGIGVGSVSQVKNTAAKLIRLAKTEGTSVIIVGHVNKDGGIAGPKVLEHMVDTVLYFDGDKQYAYRMLRAVKNRFGSTNEIGMFEMRAEGLTEVENPSEYLLSERPLGVSGTCTMCTMEGTRPVLAEIQALTTPTVFAVPRRTTTGFDYNRLTLLAAVLEKRMGIKLGASDIYMNVVGGLRAEDTSTDLPACLALISGIRDIPIADKLAAMGEIGLAGECRAIAGIEQRVKEASRLGFDTIVIPARNYARAKSAIDKAAGKAKIIPVKSLYDTFSLFPAQK